MPDLRTETHDRLAKLNADLVATKATARRYLIRQANGESLTTAEAAALAKADATTSTLEARIGEESDRLRRLPADNTGAAFRFAPAPTSTSTNPSVAKALGTLFRDAPQSSPEAWEGAVVAALGGAPSARYLAAIGSVTSAPDGGFAVPVEQARDIFERAMEESLFVKLGAEVVAMTSNEYTAAQVDDYSEASGEVGGLTGAWTAEGAEATSQVMQLEKINLKAYKLMVLANLTAELNADSPGYVSTLPNVMSKAIGRRIDLALLRGAGVGEPAGMLTSNALVTVLKEGSQAADTLIWTNVAKMWSRLAPGSHEKSVWLTNPTTLPQVLEMNVPVGTGGSLVPYVTPTANGGWSILGRPVITTSLLPSIGDLGDIMLVDASQLVVGLRQALAIESSPHPLWSSDVISFRAKWRGDAAPRWSGTRTYYDGVTRSPYVTLQAR